MLRPDSAVRRLEAHRSGRHSRFGAIHTNRTVTQWVSTLLRYLLIQTGSFATTRAGLHDQLQMPIPYRLKHMAGRTILASLMASTLDSRQDPYHPDKRSTSSNTYQWDLA